MDEQDRAEMVHRLFSGTGTTYDRIVGLTTLGLDGRWKERILEKIPAWSTRIVDQACGTGILTLKIARKFPHARVTGVDVTEEYLRIANERVKASGLPNVELILGRAEEIVPGSGFRLRHLVVPRQVCRPRTPCREYRKDAPPRRGCRHA